jgi:hypothetical protein
MSFGISLSGGIDRLQALRKTLFYVLGDSLQGVVSLSVNKGSCN